MRSLAVTIEKRMGVQVAVNWGDDTVVPVGKRFRFNQIRPI